MDTDKSTGTDMLFHTLFLYARSHDCPSPRAWLDNYETCLILCVILVVSAKLPVRWRREPETTTSQLHNDIHLDSSSIHLIPSFVCERIYAFVWCCNRVNVTSSHVHLSLCARLFGPNYAPWHTFAVLSRSKHTIH